MSSWKIVNAGCVQQRNEFSKFCEAGGGGEWWRLCFLPGLCCCGLSLANCFNLARALCVGQLPDSLLHDFKLAAAVKDEQWKPL
ncbi:hypothetical protein T4C_1232 [Trichinella pseudospiralis]|uniref:Uncharacterized protein n=1 Tax=Trichinella pseudospiralis TaxID=6337 RepID=A0A0V1J585_TRIPS|nr:hypothetical protein T4C_1232 [Trichinella pseudospiralis]